MACGRKSGERDGGNPADRLEEFVNAMTGRMVDLLKSAGEWKQGWIDGACAWPKCGLTDHEYQGFNMLFLMLAAQVRGYADNRWLTFNQALEYGKKHEIEGCCVRKGEKGTMLMRPDPCWLLADENGKRKRISEKDAKEIIDKNGGNSPENLSRVIYYRSFTVFNAGQIANFPKLEEQPGFFNADNERDAFVDDLVACSGIPVFYGEVSAPHYSPSEDAIRMFPVERFRDSAEFAGVKLHEFFHATGAEKREDRLRPGKESYAFEEMRAELFSFFAAGYLGIPIPEKNAAAYIKSWNRKFSGGDVKNVLSAARDAAKILDVIRQFRHEPEVGAKWFPKPSEWDRLRAEQKERDFAELKPKGRRPLFPLG